MSKQSHYDVYSVVWRYFTLNFVQNLNLIIIIFEILKICSVFFLDIERL